jgi:predicted DNA-binding transcriptional regulator AlpA
LAESHVSNRRLRERLSEDHLTIRHLVKDAPTFPRPVMLSTRWKLSEIEAWEALKARPSAKALADRGGSMNWTQVLYLRHFLGLTEAQAQAVATLILGG